PRRQAARAVPRRGHRLARWQTEYESLRSSAAPGGLQIPDPRALRTTAEGSDIVAILPAAGSHNQFLHPLSSIFYPLLLMFVRFGEDPIHSTSAHHMGSRRVIVEHGHASDQHV